MLRVCMRAVIVIIALAGSSLPASARQTFGSSVGGGTGVPVAATVLPASAIRADRRSTSDVRDGALRKARLARVVRQASGPAALGVETLGGTLGSALGFGAIVLLYDRTDCGENLSCTLGNAAAAVAAGTVGAAGGAYIAGRLAGTEPSGTGATLGAVAGAGAIAGIDHALSGSADSVKYVAFALAQGFLTAAGSRIGSLMR